MKAMVISLLILLLSLPAYAEDTSFCDDPKVWKHFESMVKENPNDIPLQLLHALKIGLCVKIKQNSIRPGEAIQIFNDMVDIEANKRGEEKPGGKQEF